MIELFGFPSKVGEVQGTLPLTISSSMIQIVIINCMLFL
jgi:hypothetical protein